MRLICGLYSVGIPMPCWSIFGSLRLWVACFFRGRSLLGASAVAVCGGAGSTGGDTEAAGAGGGTGAAAGAGAGAAGTSRLVVGAATTLGRTGAAELPPRHGRCSAITATQIAPAPATATRQRAPRPART